jgi:outer membrane protein assembly factor BamD (BamD/ComL family)
VLVVVGCATTKGDWEKAKKFDTILAYKEFLQKCPQSEFTADAKRRIERLKWDNTKRHSSVEGYEEFLKEYPQSEFRDEAKEKIEQLSYKNITQSPWKNQKDLLEGFLAKYPNSKFTEKANIKIQELKDFETAFARNTKESYREFIQKYPSSALIDNARRSLGITTKKCANLPPWIQSNIERVGGIGIKFEEEGKRCLSPISYDPEKPGIIFLRPLTLIGPIKGLINGALTAKIEFWIQLYYSSDPVSDDPVLWRFFPLTNLLDQVTITTHYGNIELKQAAGSLGFPPNTSTFEIMGKIDSTSEDSGIFVDDAESGPIQVTQGSILIRAEVIEGSMVERGPKEVWRFSGFVTKSQFKRLTSNR